LYRVVPSEDLDLSKGGSTVYDVAVFGSGFAGYSIAASLLEAGYNVLVVEISGVAGH
jgi:monoamine oxidase